MTQQQADTLIQTSQTQLQVQQDVSARLEGVGRLSALALWLLCAACFLLALRRIIGR